MGLLLFHLDDMQGMPCRDIDFAQYSISSCLSSSPPSASLLPPFISHLQFWADLPPSLKSLWISENILCSAAMDELILTPCCCMEDTECIHSFHYSLGVWWIYKILPQHLKKGNLDEKNFVFCNRKSRDFISVTN